MPPVIMTKVTPIPAKAKVVVCKVMLIMLATLKNFHAVIENTKIKITRPSNAANFCKRSALSMPEDSLSIAPFPVAYCDNPAA